MKKSLDAIEEVEDPQVSEKLADIAQKRAELEAQGAVIRDKIHRIGSINESLEDLSQSIVDIQDAKAALLGDDFNTYAQYIDKYGSPAEKETMQKYGELVAIIQKVDADGNITFQEARVLSEKAKQYGINIDEAKAKDENIMNTEKAMKNAKNKYSYYLADEIKSWIVFAMAIATGNPQMIYSALSQFNKKISDAESGYVTDSIKAFGKNMANQINGKSDAAYNMEQAIPELEKYDAFKQIDAGDKERAVQSLYDAYRSIKILEMTVLRLTIQQN